MCSLTTVPWGTTVAAAYTSFRGFYFKVLVLPTRLDPRSVVPQAAPQPTKVAL
jgi:hypothetical protein